MIPQEAGHAYSMVVRQGGDEFEAELSYDGLEGWTGWCTCPDGDSCAHVYAGMRALLAEHSSAVVRNLSSSNRSSAVDASAVAAATKKEEPGLARRLMAAVSRPLKPEETKFVKKVSGSFQRCRQLGHISRWDFHEMGLRLGGYGWEALQIWPAFPADEHEFWLYVARAARGFQTPIPDFMLPITDFRRIDARVAKWERNRQIEKWNQTLGNLRL
jgi:hypothetical protein